MNYFVTAIGTDSGKTLISAILAEALHADYWKPVQAGFPTDTEKVSSLISNKSTTYWPEQYLLKTPASPHSAAKIEGICIELAAFKVPYTSRDLIIEGAGGALVPLNQEQTVIDLAAMLRAEVVVVSNLYLGSINHTLLTAEALANRKINVKGVIFNGESNPESEAIILYKTGWKKLLHVFNEPTIDRQVVLKYAERLKENW